MLKLLPLIFLIFLAIYSAFAASVFFFADRLVFLPPPASYDHHPTRDPHAINILTGDANVIAARYFHHPAGYYTILYSHGNASDIGTVSPILETLYAQGFSVLAYDYPGYGSSSGKASEAGAYNAIAATYSYLNDTLNVPPEKIILHGQSLGGGPSTYLAAQLAAKTPVAGLILESTFSSIFQVITRFSILPFDKFPTIQRINKINCPLLIIHGTHDQTISLSHAQTLFASAQEPKQLVAIAEADHNNLLWVDRTTYLNAIQTFADSLQK
ncbi:MAG: alpha/beta hydrolase [Phormidesmis priestleyi]|uniref:Alpha/beta hydrolase n=1 Tax=Phormidesmis priestleyi TaxID=268141 RepID=A0A2W4X5L3_9CYAN|nr:MAG: alpha/beta hydrolase [Phormidesmis priestleyi]